MTRYDFTTHELKLCDGTNWQPIGSGIPTGTIAAFAAATCPAGWTEYVAARGRFLRGIDNGAGLDPDGTRAAGNTQADTVGPHTHPLPNGGYMMTIGGGGGWTGGSVYNGLKVTETSSNSGTETRPKNVAVLFCRYQGGAPLAATPSGAAGEIQYADGAGGLASDSNIVISGGKLGIGTTTPGEKLEVSGNVKMGYERITNDCGSGVDCVATCSSGKYILGGGCWLTSAWTNMQHEPSGNSAYHCMANGSTVRVTAICANIR